MRTPKTHNILLALCSVTGLSTGVQAASCQPAATAITCPQPITRLPKQFSFISDQQITLETAAQQTIILDANQQDARTFDQLLTSISQGADTGNPAGFPFRINLSQPNLYYTVGSDKSSEAATLANTPGLYLLPYLTQRTTALTAAYFVYTATDGTLKQRLLPPLPADWERLNSALTQLNFTAVMLEPNGIITATMSNGKVYQAVMGYDVQRGTPINEQLIFDTDAGNINADGSSDFNVIYPNGDRQMMRVFTDTQSNSADVFIVKSAGDQANANAYLLATTQPATLVIDLNTDDYNGETLRFDHFSPGDKIRFTLADGIVKPGAGTQHSATANQYFSSLNTVNAQHNDFIIHADSKAVITLLSSAIDTQSGATQSNSLHINLTGGIKNKNLLFEFF